MTIILSVHPSVQLHNCWRKLGLWIQPRNKTSSVLLENPIIPMTKKSTPSQCWLCSLTLKVLFIRNSSLLAGLSVQSSPAMFWTGWGRKWGRNILSSLQYHSSPPHQRIGSQHIVCDQSRPHSNVIRNKCLVLLVDTVGAMGGQALKQYCLPEPTRSGGVICNREYVKEIKTDSGLQKHSSHPPHSLLTKFNLMECFLFPKLKRRRLDTRGRGPGRIAGGVEHGDKKGLPGEIQIMAKALGSLCTLPRRQLLR